MVSAQQQLVYGEYLRRMKIKPDYKVFTFKKVPYFIEDDAGGGRPRARPSVKVAAGITFLIVLIFIVWTKMF
jgi:hypothetical protein